MGERGSETAELLRRAADGNADALGQIWTRHRERLRRMVEVRLDRRLQGRLDASDILQEAYLEVSRSLAGYLRNPAVPFFLWMRHITGMKLQALHRRHLGAKMRAAGRETSLNERPMPEASSASMACQLLGRFSTPSQSSSAPSSAHACRKP